MRSGGLALVGGVDGLSPMGGVRWAGSSRWS